MDNLPSLPSLPPSMRLRALWAREQILLNPKVAKIDEDELLAWVYNDEDKVWYSIAGNYSFSSPMEKMAKRRKQIEKNEKYKKDAEKYYLKAIAEQKYYSEVRERILRRDNWTCQKCGQKISKLHVHHIIKRKEARVDTDDNLITVCHKCHKKLDGKEYGVYNGI